MKKLISVCLTLALLAALAVPAFAFSKPVDSFGAYEHVFIIGVDGAGRFFKDADTPNFDRIFAEGAVDYTARAEIETTSAQNWGAMLTGVSYGLHGMTNGSTETQERTSDTLYPTIFTYVNDAFPDAELASFVNWNNINYGMIENDIGVNKVHVGDDGALTDEICAYFDGGAAPTLFFVQFDSVDHAGHESGSKSAEFIKQIETVDGYIGRIYDTLEENGLMENGLFLVVADHGHTTTGGHGGVRMRETNVTMAAAGKTVVKGGRLDLDARNRDIAAIALYALGIERPRYMTSRVPGCLFQGVVGELRPIFNDFDDAFRSAVYWIATLFTVLMGE